MIQLDFKSSSDSMQAEKISLSGAKGLLYMKIIIADGYDDFASIHYVEMV